MMGTVVTHVLLFLEGFQRPSRNLRDTEQGESLIGREGEQKQLNATV